MSSPSKRASFHIQVQGVVEISEVAVFVMNFFLMKASGCLTFRLLNLQEVLL
jgi:hypothetical protein